jgi:polyadenylate-binding protein
LAKEIRFPELGGKVCRVMAYDKELSAKQFDQRCSVFVKGLDRAWTHKELFGHFSEFGDIVSAKVSLQENHQSRGYGFVTFAKEE